MISFKFRRGYKSFNFRIVTKLYINIFTEIHNFHVRLTCNLGRLNRVDQNSLVNSQFLRNLYPTAHLIIKQNQVGCFNTHKI